MTAEKKLIYGFIILVVILICIMIYFVFKGNKSIEQSSNEKVVAAKDETISILKQLSAQKDQSILDHERNDSLLRQQLLNNKPKYIINENKLESIPAIINALSKDSLRRAIQTY